jgi:hypothetical protein
MVERPVKKSERPAKDTNPDSVENAQPSEQRSSTPPVRKDKDRVGDDPRRENRGKGKRDGKKDEPRVAGNPALMRGPKPVQAKPVVEEVPPEETAPELEAVEDVAVEESAAEDTAAEASAPEPEVVLESAPVESAPVESAS